MKGERDMPKVPVCDPSILAELAESMPENELASLLTTLHDSILAFQEELPVLPWATMRSRVHYLASSAWALGVLELAAAAADLDRALAEPTATVEIGELLARFECVLAATACELEPGAVARTGYAK